MNKLFQIIFILSFGLYFSQINVEEIKKNVTENPQEYNNYLEVFKKNPKNLTQQQMNFLYYGSRFMGSGDEISNYNDDYKEIWKVAEKKTSKSKAEKILAKAEAAYAKDPLNKSILKNMSNIYRSLDDKSKEDLAVFQYNAVVNTIGKSGSGASEDSPICVIWPGDVISQIDNLRGYGTSADFKQNMKFLPDGSMLTVYSMGSKKIFVKLVGGFR
ncbi:DUF4919 domain-containing protein [Chryseobacterium lathyri]|uniref:DUF4919 domain-containing protein n=1 Tax=Chryseobacterium lathyri TaxID=395933 RepID=A0ABT9SH93_9FLAO|nr:DUF4919 domain-containing protein [Chryseobacterium lathyri]MDP9958633.1 hypothetical protein [Chryseobacterium lathyri]